MPLKPGSPAPSRQAQIRLARKKRLEAKKRFEQASRSSKIYSRQLASVAQQVQAVIDGFVPQEGQPDMAAIEAALKRYSETIEPWARAVAEKMIRQIGLRDKEAWMAASKDIGVALRSEMLGAISGREAQRLLQEQVSLIKSVPLQTAEKIFNLAGEATFSGMRSDTLAKRLVELGVQSGHRARTIARTEVGRVGAAMMQARAQSVGVTQYRWHTAGDGDVRHSHAVHNGKVFEFANPPIIGEEGGRPIRGNPGEIYNCRCWSEPILPDSIL